MHWTEWFFVVYWSLLVLVAILFWIAEFSSIGSKRQQKKSEWDKSKERVTYNYNSYKRY
jgi:hypothetical protein